MNHKKPPVQIIVIVVLVIAFSVYFLVTQGMGKKDEALTASGFIEATQINLAAEMSGKVTEVLVEEGQPVTEGEALLRLDPSLLAAQRAAAAAALDTANSAAQTAQAGYQVAQAQYDITLASARAAGAQARLADWVVRTPNYFDQPLWYFTREEQIAAAQQGVLSAAQEVETAEKNLETVVKDLNNADFVEAETRLMNARMTFLSALDVHTRAQMTGGSVSPSSLPVSVPPSAPGYRIRIDAAKSLAGPADLVDAAQDMYDLAKEELDSAQEAYDDLLGSEGAENVQAARAQLSVALERYAVAQDRLSMLQTGEDSLGVLAAKAGLAQAQAAVEQALTAAKQAEANLALIDTQLAKLVITAPTDCVVLTRNVEPGEFVQPGATAFILGRLNALTITVYVPNDRFGEIQLGQTATVRVDSFSGQTFTATVIRIADKAEFTPRNVQTVEGRSSTVYAIKLSVDNADGKLKIGMPADVVFGK